ncbi:MAG: hypothetical protein IJ164_05835 [Duodenibacillus sp.]|nr:hypothetical protein [Duodenibacillus sp.]
MDEDPRQTQDSESIDRGLLIEELENAIGHYFADITDSCGYPYIQHCLYVGHRAAELSGRYYGDEGHREMAFVIGLCHDVYENLRANEQQNVDNMLRRLYPDNAAYRQVKRWLDLLTHDPDALTYAEYFERITHSRMASLVKAADAHHNGTLSRWKFRLQTMTDKQACQIRKACGEYKGRSRKLIELLDNDRFEEA